MTTRQRIARRPGAAPKRVTAWDDTLIDLTVANLAATQSQGLVQNVADPEKRGCTAVRMILHLQLFPTSPGAVSGVQNVQFGVGLVSDDAFVAAAMPDPSAGDDFPVGGWMYRDSLLVVDETIATGPVPFTVVKQDLKVQRKLGRSTVALMANNTAIQGSNFAIGFRGIIRILYKLP